MNKRAGWLIASTTAIVVIAIIAVVLKVGIDAPAIDNKNADPGTVAFNPGVDLIPEEARCTDNHYIDSSIRVVQAGNQDYRQFATAVSIPYKGSTDKAVYKETSTELCGNPTELKMVADDMMLWTGFPGADENKAWIVKIQNDIKEHGLDSFITKNDAGDLIVTPTYLKYAGWFNTVLLRFNTEGKQSLASTRNWELPATVTPGTQPVAVQATTPESKPTWVRTLRDKNTACLYRIGFNAEDKRIETFPCAVPPTPGAPPTSHPTPTPSPTPPPTPSCTVPQNCPTQKNHKKDDAIPPQGTTPLGSDPVQPVAPAPQAAPLDPSTPVTADPGPSTPVQEATPAPVAPTAPSIPVTQQPTPTDPGTPITDPDNG